MDQERAVSDLAPLNLAPTLAGPTVGKGCAADVLDELVSIQGIAEAVGTLAQLHWDDDAHVLDAVQGAHCLQHDVRPTKRVGVYYHALGTGGAERVTLDLLELWTSMGLEVTLLCDEGSEVPASVERLGIATVFLPGFETAVRDAYPARAQALYQALCDYELDALVYSQWLSSTVAWDLLVAKLAGVAFVYYSHGSARVLSAYRQPRFLRLPALVRHCDAVVCLSGEDESFWRLFHAHVYCIGNQIDKAFLAHPAVRCDGHTVVWVGRLDGDKCPQEALQAFAKTLQKGGAQARLMMVGPYGDLTKDGAKALVDQLGIADAVEFVGNVAHDELPRVLATADVFLLTSHYEGYCIALGEAKAMGLACVTYDLNNLTLLEGREGVLTAPVGDVDALAERLAAVLGDESCRIQLGTAARAHMERLAQADAKAQWREVFEGLTSDFAPQQNDRAALCAWLMADMGMSSQVVQDDRDQKYGELVAMTAERDRLHDDLGAVTGSASFRLGRAFTAPLRLARDAMGKEND